MIPKTIREPIEELLRKDATRTKLAIRRVSPEATPSPTALQAIADGIRIRLEHITMFAAEEYAKVGRDLQQIKDRLPHGHFMRLFRTGGKDRVPTPIPLSLQQAEAFMRIGTNRVFRDPEVQKALPAHSWRILDELGRVEPAVLRRGVRSGRVHPEMTRAEATALQQRADDDRIPVHADPFIGIESAIAAYAGDREALVQWMKTWLQEHGGQA